MTQIRHPFSLPLLLRGWHFGRSWIMSGHQPFFAPQESKEIMLLKLRCTLNKLTYAYADGVVVARQ